MAVSTRAKLTTTIGIIVLLATLLVAIGSYGLFSLVSIKTAQGNLQKEAEEIIDEHIQIQDGRLIFYEKEGIPTIEQDLQTDQYSSVIFTAQGELLGAFGIFEVKQMLLERLAPVKEVAMKRCVDQSISFENRASLTISSQELIYYPVVSKNVCYGVVVVALNMTMLETVRRIMLIALIVFCVVALVVAGLFTRRIVDILLFPLRKVATTMKTLSIHNVPDELKPLSLPPDDEINQMVTAFNEMVVRVKEGAEKQKAFIANASHELKSPLARLSSSLDVAQLYLKKGKIEDAQSNIVAVRSELLSLGEMVETLLTTAQLQANSLERSVFSLSSVLDGIIDNNLKDIHQKDLTVIKEYSGNLSVESDERVVALMLRNIIHNAVKYTPKRGSIVIKVNQPDESIVIQNDADEQESAQIVSRFARGQNAKKASGYGLGLAIVLDLAELIHCRVTVSSEEYIFRVVIKGIPTGSIESTST